MSPRCMLCDGLCRKRFRASGYDVYRCDRCDLERVWPTPSPEAIDAVYQRGYFTGPGAGYEDYFTREREIAARKAATRLDRLRDLGVASGRLLDVGCASGYFLEAAAARGFEVFGVERSDEARARCVPTLRERVAPSLDAMTGCFDAITLWDVLEHLPDPPDTLAALLPRLAPRGVLGVVIPVIGSVNTRIAPRTWDQYKPPEHLWFFSPSALRALLARHGLTVVHEEPAWTRTARFIDPDARRRDPFTRALRGIDALAHAALAGLLGERVRIDSMAFYARRSAP